MKSQKGQSLRSRNAELEKELAAKTRDLEIEAALERVRARAMAMQNSGELNGLIGAVFNELMKLDLLVTRCRLWIFDPASLSCMTWQANQETPANPLGSFIKYNEQPFYLAILKAWKERSLKLVYELKGDEKKSWDEFLFNETEFSRLPEVVKEGMRSPERVLLSASFGNFGAMQTGSLDPLSDEQMEILSRFVKVFDMTYTRFNDLKKAEEQAREAQIETALEKVRGKAMAMHNSNDLSSAVSLVFTELKKLGIKPIRCGVGLFAKDTPQSLLYTATISNDSDTLDLVGWVDMVGHPVLEKIYDSWLNQEDYFPVLNGKELKTYYKKLSHGLHIPSIPDGRSDEKQYGHFLPFPEGMLNAWAGRPYVEPELKILDRFKKIISLTFRRYLDLQKAEEQAREAQIETALERVRSRTMGMQKSEELRDVIQVIYEQLTQLNFHIDAANFALDYKESDDFNLWVAVPGQAYPAKIHVPYMDHPIFNRIVKAKVKVPALIVDCFTSEQKNSWFQYFFEFVPTVPAERKKFIFSSSGLAISTVLMTNVALSIMNYSAAPYSDAEDATLMRLGKVFEQTYTRFTDLKQAEEQARESQIQLALERVRARTMAMQHSDELPETAAVLFQQFNNLGVTPERIFIGTIKDDSHNIYFWGTEQGGNQMSPMYEVNADATFSFSQIYKAWTAKKRAHTVVLKGKKLDEHVRYIRNVLKMPIQQELIREQRILYNSFFSKGLLMIVTPEKQSQETLDILERFTRVFDGTYTRFLDLQKAEGQAREAKIETALERVRSKTMAMHNSEDVGVTVATMFDELVKLGVATTVRCGVTIIDNTKQMEVWTASSTSNGEATLTKGRLDMTIHPLLLNIFNAWKNKKPSTSYELVGQDLRDYYQAIIASPDYPFQHQIESLPEKQINNAFFFPEGCLFAFTTEPLSADAAQLFKKFAGVFGLTYRRFLDLQKAEAQAREAQIEAALERVRSRSMAMQKSEELAIVIQLIYQQLIHLNFQIDSANFTVDYKESDDVNIWLTSPNFPFPPKIHIAYLDTPILSRFAEAKRKGLDFYAGVCTVEEKNQFLHHFYKSAGGVPDSIKEFFYNSPGYAQSVVLLEDISLNIQNFSGVSYSEAENGTLMRFAKVFQQTYTRFLDLQKAEAQAREARIEAALERVRSRTMAMFKSDELKEVIQLVYEQLQHLNFNINTASFALNFKESHDYNAWIASPGEVYPTQVHIPYFDHPLFNAGIEALKSDVHFFAGSYTFEEKNRFFDHFFEYAPGIAEERKKLIYGSPGYAISMVILKTTALSVANFAAIPYSDAENDTLGRFANVFEQTYTRFLDLQKAEVQVREAQIQLALERVRARTMAMQKSEELPETAAILFQQLDSLGIKPERTFIALIDDDTRRIDFWGTEQGGDQMSPKFEANLDATFAFRQIYKGWKAKKRLQTVILKGKDLDEHIGYVSGVLNMPIQQGLLEEERILNNAFFSKGLLMIVTYEMQSKETLDILDRFAGVFDGTYTRFIDLQKAEGQTREAKIEAALERVRSKTMAMHNSQDVGDTVATMFDELVKLGVETLRCGIFIIDETKHMEVWTAVSNINGKAALIIGKLDMMIHPFLHGGHNAWKNKQSVFLYEMVGQDLEDYYLAINNSSDYPIRFDVRDLPAKQFVNDFFFPEGALFAFTADTLSEETSSLFKRFAGVFGQTYRRFLDLQKAEAQAREAKIEAALERVRAAAMAMHDSNDVGNATALVFSELYKLGITTIRCGVVIIEESTKLMEVWAATSPMDGKVDQGSGKLDMTSHPLWQNLFDTWKQKKPMLTYELAGQDLLNYYTAISNAPGYKAPQIDPSYTVPDNISSARQFCNCFLFAEGGLFAFTRTQFSSEESKILEKFTAVFSLTYRRYLDLKLAEEQAREAKIEAALERVRGKAMAMHSSADLSLTTGMVFSELRKLGINPLRCGVALLSKNSRTARLYVATSSMDIDSLDMVGAIELSGHRDLENQYGAWLKKENYFTVLKGKELKSYKEIIYSMLPVPYDKRYHEEFGCYLCFSEGLLFSWAERPFSENELNILNRFKAIIDLTFRRYIELQKSEANAQEAIRQSSLDRVRAEIASMRTTKDLERITPLVWNELTILGIPFVRCGVFIMDDTLQLIHTFLSTPDGKAIGAFHIPFDTSNNFERMVSNWRDKKIYTDHWGDAVFTEFANTLVKQGAIASTKQYLSTLPSGGVHVNFLPFLQGMLYVGNTSPLAEEEITLVQLVADSFSTAYARYEDFNKLEAAKQQVDKTLTELKAAQTKLIQSEKMASLGELTAGIAHEIQNPLNFVNNFSEVNTELIDEMKEEIAKGNMEEVLAIAEDIKDNEQKINMHGKRADGIVKGMLEHSRSRTGQKELTNLNVMADEYMRLSYHGLRAKDKEFNAEMITHFDPKLPKINVVQQDMGRIFLNLFNNAFYAVSQKKKIAGNNYKPEVEVSTFAENNHVILKVKDNGSGIPDNIKDKIMQPFFTTKPTGEGTGLGLSLTYDMVVKGHGGSIQVDTKDGNFTEFIISLPIT